MSGRIITIEGNNGSGKQTQTEMLASKFEIQNLKYQTFSYPEYETSTGLLIGSYLKGDFGPKEELFEFAALLYAADRMKNRHKYLQFLAEGAVIINDRYRESSWAILGSLFEDPALRSSKIEWMQELEKEMPASDLVIFLDMPYEQAYELISQGRVQNGRPLDTHEMDLDFLQRCERTYRELADNFGWKRIACVRDGQVKSREEIAEEVWEMVQKLT